MDHDWTKELDALTRLTVSQLRGKYAELFGDPTRLVDRQLTQGKAVAALASIAPDKKVHIRHDVGFDNRQ
jgi:hypothetical protein